MENPSNREQCDSCDGRRERFFEQSGALYRHVCGHVTIVRHDDFEKAYCHNCKERCVRGEFVRAFRLL